MSKSTLRRIIYICLLIFSTTNCDDRNTCWQEGPMKGVAVFEPDAGSNIHGVLQLSQDNPYSPLEINGEIKGFVPESIHAFHVHANGNFTHGCKSTFVSNFNANNNTVPFIYPDPFRDTPSFGTHWPIQKSNEYGEIQINIIDSIVSLCGKNSIVGRPFVLHKTQDGGTVLIGCALIGYTPI